MKKIILLITFLIGITGVIMSQTISVDTSKLSATAKAEIERSQIKTKIDNNLKEASDWAGMGKEIGEGVNGALSAITTNVDKIGDTKVGKFTMFLVAWHIIGNKFIRILCIPIIMLIIILMFIYILNKWTMPRSIKTKDALKDDTGKKIISPAEYQIYKPDYMINARAYIGVIFFIFMFILVLLMVL